MDIKRIMSGIIGMPLVALGLFYANTAIVDIALVVVALIAMYEYLNTISKVSNPIKWVAYASCFSIGLIHIIPQELLGMFIIIEISTILSILFLNVILTDMKINFKDVAYTFLGIIYVVFFISFIGFIYGMKAGKILIWYVIIASWGTDIFAYIIGKHFGNHKFSKISPKKSLEGCIAGIIGAIILMQIYTYILNTYLETNYSYLALIGISIILSLLSQIGDFVASSIKRYAGVKDYGNIIPGHGGILDRIDSLIFIAPFTYVLFSLL